MAQQQGNSSSDGGRLDGTLQKNTVVAGDFALGAGWGTTPVVAVTAGSTDQRGSISITADATPAQATATVVFTFADGAYAATPFALVNLQDSTSAADDAQPTSVECTTTALSWTCGVLPVDTKVYIFNWVVVA